MDRLNISSSRPVLDITSTKAQLNVTNKFRRFKARRVPPEMTVDRKMPSFKLNWKKVWNESGRKSPEALKQHFNQMSRRKLEQAIQNTVSTGNYLMDIKNYIGNSGNPLSQIIWQQMMTDASVETNVASMPESSPEITWDPGHIKIEWTTGEIQIEWDDSFMPDVTVTPHSVEIKLSGHKGVKISVDEDKVATTGGKKVNKKV